MRKIWQDRVAILLIILLCIFLANYAKSFPAGGNVFPLFALLSILLLSLFYLVSTFLKSEVAQSDPVESITRIDQKPMVLCLLLTLKILLLNTIGYFAVTALFIIFAPIILGLKQYKAIIITLIILLPAFYVIFVLALKTSLPSGILM